MMRWLICCLLVAAPAGAWEGVEVLETEAAVRFELFAQPTPVPAYCYFDHGPTPGPLPPVTENDGYGIYCDHSWALAGTAEELSFRGEWPWITDDMVLSLEYRVDAACRVNVVAPTRLCAERVVETGPLTVDEHALSLVRSDWSAEWLLEPGAGPDAVHVVLEPGIYEVRLHVKAYRRKDYGTDVPPYDGRVELRWEDPATVAEERADWGLIKSLYRP